MKHFLRMSTLLTLSFFCVESLHAQSIKERIQGWLPKDPRTSLNPIESHIPNIQTSPFSLSSLKTPQAVSNAMNRLVQAFKLLSPRTLAQIIKTQKEKFEKNSEAFAENPTWAQRGAMVANVLAISAATIALGVEAAMVGYGIKQGVDAGKRYKQRKQRQTQEIRNMFNETVKIKEYDPTTQTWITTHKFDSKTGKLEPVKQKTD